MAEFIEWKKIPRYSNEHITITEKIDGTNAQFTIENGTLTTVGSRTRFITPESDNMGFARWCQTNQYFLEKFPDGTQLS